MLSLTWVHRGKKNSAHFVLSFQSRLRSSFFLVGSTLGTAFVSFVVVLYTYPANIDLGFAVRTKYMTVVYDQFWDLDLDSLKFLWFVHDGGKSHG